MIVVVVDDENCGRYLESPTAPSSHSGINLLREKGSLCFVLPAAWDFANYARPLREQIAGAFERVEVYRCGEPLFHAAEIQDGAVVLVARGKRPPNTNEQPQRHVSLERWDFSKGADLIRALRSARGASSSASLDRPKNRKRAEAAAHSDSISVRLGDIAMIQLGGVTGDAGYFLLTEEERLEWALPAAALRPVVTRAKHLHSASMTPHQWRALLDLGERVWLFRPPRWMVGHPAVRSYLAYGEQGGCNRASHKISNRAVWYGRPSASRSAHQPCTSARAHRRPILSIVTPPPHAAP